MQPDTSKIRISDNLAQIVTLLDELVLRPRLELVKWSKITKQTPNVKIGYPGQHLASLITGVEGSRSGARGHDLADGSEVKSCSRIDQLDKCLACGAAVARLETECSECQSVRIKRNNDSKWLFGIRSESELTTLTQGLDRVLLMIGDHPNFDEGEYSTLRFQAFEIWPKDPRHKHFVSLMTAYYEQIYLVHRAASPNKTPAPKNFWPYSFQFYMCNPVKVFQATVKDAETNPVTSIDHFVDPETDRTTVKPEAMPTSLLSPVELAVLSQVPDDLLGGLLLSGSPSQFRSASPAQQRTLLHPFDEKGRELLKLRDAVAPVPHASEYTRRQI